MAQSETYKKFPYAIQNLDPAINEKLSNDYSDGMSDLVQVGPEKMILSGPFRDNADEYYNFELRPDDVIITGYPRSGTTLAENMVWWIVNGLNVEKTTEMDYSLRIPFFEAHSMWINMTEKLKMKKLETLISSLEILKNSTERRVFKTHLHLNFLPPNLFEVGCKIVYMAREPKDVIVSNYWLHRSWSGRSFLKDFKSFYEYFRNGMIWFTPYWAHVQQGWEKRGLNNFRFLFYEDIIKDLRKSVKEMADFLEKDLSNSELDLLSENLKFEKFKETVTKSRSLTNVGPGTNVDKDFIRRGKIGGWKDYFTEEKMRIDVDKWIVENVDRIGITYPSSFDNRQLSDL